MSQIFNHISMYLLYMLIYIHFYACSFHHHMADNAVTGWEAALQAELVI